MSTLKATYLQQASSASPNITLDASTNATVAGTLAMGSSFKRNRIINGDMRVDQRNAGASVTPINLQYTLDRWSSSVTAASKYTVQQNAGSVTPPVGFSNYLGVTSTSAYSVVTGDAFGVYQKIEGYNIADLAWGTANAKTVTLSFQVYSSLTGTFSGVLQNSAATTSYAFIYSISSANTWTTISIAIPGSTSGTWLTTNGLGLWVYFNLGVGSTYSTAAGTWADGAYYGSTGSVSVVGTNGATFYLTGVQLETGSIATPYERQIYSDQLAQCQRYLPFFSASSGFGPFGVGMCSSNTAAYIQIPYIVPPRTTPTGTITTAASTFGCWQNNANVTTPTAVAYTLSSLNCLTVQASGMSGLVAGDATALFSNNVAAQIYCTGCEL